MVTVRYNRESISHEHSQCTLTQAVNELEVHESAHRDTIIKVTNKMQLYMLIYYS